MYDDKQPGFDAPADPLSLGIRLASSEPVRARRPSGSIFESRSLGRMEFVQMPRDQASFWYGALAMPDSRYSLHLTCEVRSDRYPGPDHVACITAIRRRQVREAYACLAVINDALRDADKPACLNADELILTGIHLPPRPLLDARSELAFRSRLLPRTLLTVVLTRGRPQSARVEREA